MNMNIFQVIQLIDDFDHTPFGLIGYIVGFVQYARNRGGRYTSPFRNIFHRIDHNSFLYFTLLTILHRQRGTSGSWSSTIQPLLLVLEDLRNMEVRQPWIGISDNAVPASVRRAIIINWQVGNFYGFIQTTSVV